MAPSTQAHSVVVGAPIRVRNLSFPSTVASHRPNTSRSNPLFHASRTLRVVSPIRPRRLKGCEASLSLSENSSLISGDAGVWERERTAKLSKTELRNLVSGIKSKMVSVDEDTLILALRACAHFRKLSFGRQVHEVAREQGFHLKIDVAYALSIMYAKCGCFDDASDVLSKFPARDIKLWTAIITGLVDHGRFWEALEMFHAMRVLDDLEPAFMIITKMLKACAQLEDPFLGRELHGFTCKKDFRHRSDVGNSLLNMYSKCGFVDAAHQVFVEMPERDVISWTTMIGCFVDHNRCEEALDLFVSMEDGDGVEPNEMTMSKVIQACARIRQLSLGKELNKFSREKRFYRGIHVATTFLDMYAKCGCIEAARQVFREMPKQDVVSWCAMINALVDHDRCEEAVELFQRMRHVDGLKPCQGTIIDVLRAFEVLGKPLSPLLPSCGLKDCQTSESLSGNWYLVSGESARQEREWAASSMELEVWDLIRGDGAKLVLADGVAKEKALILAFRTFANLKKLSFGRRVHVIARKWGLHRGISVAHSLMKMYSKCGSIEDARKVFDEMPERGFKSWKIIISELVDHGRCREALELFLDMRYSPNRLIITKLLKACALVDDPFLGEQLHGIARRKGLLRKIEVPNALMNMYIKCGFIEPAEKLFDEMRDRDVFSWTTMISGLVDHDRCQEAVDLFLRMEDVDGIEPNKETITKLLKACARLEKLSLGMALHEFARKKGFHRLTYVASALLDMYAKCDCIETARQVFREMPKRDVVSWNAMINALVDHHQHEEALEMFQRMSEIDGFEPDATTITKVLKACGFLHARRLGQELHGVARKKGLVGRKDVASSLVFMYSKCRDIDTAREVFDETTDKSVILWTTMIEGLFVYGRHREAVDFFLLMRDLDGVEPNERTLGKVLDACAQP